MNKHKNETVRFAPSKSDIYVLLLIIAILVLGVWFVRFIQYELTQVHEARVIYVDQCIALGGYHVTCYEAFDNAELASETLACSGHTGQAFMECLFGIANEAQE